MTEQGLSVKYNNWTGGTQKKVAPTSGPPELFVQRSFGLCQKIIDTDLPHFGASFDEGY